MKFVRYDLEADSSDWFQSNRVCRAKIKVIIEVAKSDRILQKAVAKSFGSRLKTGRVFSNVFGLRGK